MMKPEAEEKQQMFVAKLSIVILGFIATYCGLQASSLLGQILGAMQIRAVAGIIIFISIFWKRFDSRAAFWSLLGGGLVAAAWHFAGQPFGIVPLWPALLVCFAIMLPLVLTGSKEPSKGSVFVDESVKRLLQEEENLEYGIKV